ncbi:ABC transporter permease [Corynebacterium sp. 153RC1]|uniref:ABC transporter permease n=1 Tax=unclassified Corynebacterium TaxID=2624378 RepID=UPI00211C49B8|nr:MULTISPECIES: ABC transporter permease [unclassified Corynebacterium]MCQ9356278.1 ABC transporter permease [Corynebacterium sp. 122RC1]MCQ9370335.1 ABC transporter permease [Corynebacterium sp. 35RC1]MCQ9358380.1 ABC transporter permease [Corynebacterium sp. 142RC1]MCQ9360885.1 ABC transporter permease [Corynebacterium sp. 153RC1]MCQ9365168.1 ABC transporter permease [Corynebacterium sp. 70RC1]
MLGINTWWFSAIVLVLAIGAGTWKVGNASVIVASAVLCAPAAISMVLVHAPYGQQRIALFVTLDGLATAGVLALRFCALIVVVLAAVAWVETPALLKALQVSGKGGLGTRLAVIVGQTLQLAPQAARARGTVRDAMVLQGIPVRGPRAVVRVALMVMIHVITQGADRAAPMKSAGLELVGQKTLLYPLQDSAVQKAVRGAMVVFSFGVIAWISLW